MRIVNLVEDTPGDPYCGYEHGLSFYIETERHKILMDSGASDLFSINADILGIDLKKVDSFILSHGHYDHAGGIMTFNKICPSAKIYVRNTVGGEYYSLNGNTAKYIGIDPGVLELPQLIAVGQEFEIDKEIFLFADLAGTGYISKGNSLLKKKEGGAFVQDTFEHEQCLVITQCCKRILFSGCAHNGILNILSRYHDIFQSWPDIVISGFHMMQKQPYSDRQICDIRMTAEELKKTRAVFYTGHCTGREAFDLMKEVMGDLLQPIHSGIEIPIH